MNAIGIIHICLNCFDIPSPGTACNVTPIGHLQSSGHLGRKVVVLGHGQIKDGVADAVVDGKRRLGILGRVDRVAAKGIAKRDLLGHVHLGVPHVVVTPLGAALARGGDLEVRGVDERRLLEDLVRGGLVEWGGVVTASSCQSMVRRAGREWDVLGNARGDDDVVRPVGPHDGQRVVRHGSAPGEAGPADGDGRHDLEDRVELGAGGDDGRDGHAVGDAAVARVRGELEACEGILVGVGIGVE